MRKISICSQSGAGIIQTYHNLYKLIGFAVLVTALSFGLSSCKEGSEIDLPKGLKDLDFQQAELTINDKTISVELAVTMEQQARGLMFRKSLPENHGMLFFFEQPKQASFWMKNTLIPLSIAFIDQQGTILEIYPLEPLDTSAVVSRSYRVKYALEMNRNWFNRNQIQAGDKIQGIPGEKVSDQ